MENRQEDMEGKEEEHEATSSDPEVEDTDAMKVLIMPREERINVIWLSVFCLGRN